MRNTSSLLIPALLVLLTPMPDAQRAAAEVTHAAEFDLPEREELHQSYELAPGAGVELSNIPGSVKIETTDSDTAEVNIVRSAETPADLACGKIVIEPTPARLRISSEPLCPIVRSRERVMLKLPRGADITLHNIAGDVRIGPTDGIVRLNSIAGHVDLAQLSSGKLSSLAGGLSLSIARVGAQGIHVSSVTGGIELNLDQDIDAELVMRSVNHVHSEDLNVLESSDDHSNYRAVIGAGGNKILIDSVVGSVNVRRKR